MNPYNFFYSVPSVSKSLLIVLGTFPLSCRLYCFAVCPYQGSRFYSPARLHDFQRRDLVLPTMLASLDNSTRCTDADFRKRKKCHVWFRVGKGGLLQRSGAGFPLRCSSPALRGAYPLRRDSASDKIRVIHPSVKGNIR
jgi:hypothetical protein